MYEWFAKISSFLSGPFSNAANTEVALLAALFLGFIGSVAPCQLSANIAVIAYFGNRQFQAKLSWKETIMYMMGKILVFSVLGLVFWLFGLQVSRDLIPFLSTARRMLGPLLVLIGLFLLGLIRVPFSLGMTISEGLKKVSSRVGGMTGAFLMGIAFSLGFCPTMFVLFFGSVMPLALGSSYGFVLPPVFAVGTSMPFLLFAGLAVGFGLDRVMVRRAKRWGGWIQKGAGIFFILFGISDTYTYWFI